MTHVQLNKSVAAIAFSPARPTIDIQLAERLTGTNRGSDEQKALLDSVTAPTQVALPQVLYIRFYRKGKNAPKKLTGRELRLINEAIARYQTEKAVAFSEQEVKQAHLDWIYPTSCY